MSDQLHNIPLNEIFFDEEFNCRGEFTYQSLDTLKESIINLGLRTPILVQPYENSGYKYRILCGHRRYRVAELLKWETIPAFIDAEISEEDAKLLNMSENIERSQLNILEEAKAIKKAYGHLPYREIGRRLNRDAKWVNRRFNLLKEPKFVRDAAATGRLREIHLDAIHGMDTRRAKIELCRDFLENEDTLCWHTSSSDDRAEAGDIKEGGHIKGKRRFPTKKDIAELITTMLDASIVGMGPRALAYTAGWITREELEEDIRRLRDTGTFDDTTTTEHDSEE